jgi:hypothetical protein
LAVLLELELGRAQVLEPELGPAQEQAAELELDPEAPEAPVRLPPRLLQGHLHQRLRQFRRLLYYHFYEFSENKSVLKVL